MNASSQTHPYFVRLFVDLDPARNPIGRGAVLYERGQEVATLWFDAGNPFDSIADAFESLICDHETFVGEQLTLF